MNGNKIFNEGSDWFYDNYELKNKHDIESLNTDPNSATSAHSYSWIKKSNIVRSLIDDSEFVLDVGCGFGRDLSRYDSAVGIDLSFPMLKAARKITGKSVILASVFSLPFRSSVFDGVISLEVIEHLQEPKQYLDEIQRVLCDGGKVVLTTPNKKITREKTVDDEYGHEHEYTKKEISYLLSTHKFEVHRITGSTIPYIPSKHKFHGWNSNPIFFAFWKLLNRVLFSAKWDIIILAINRKNSKK